jgi:hypothetical protein
LLQFARQTFQRIVYPVALVTLCANVQSKVMESDGSAQSSWGWMFATHPPIFVLPDSGIVLFHPLGSTVRKMRGQKLRRKRAF